MDEGPWAEHTTKKGRRPKPPPVLPSPNQLRRDCIETLLGVVLDRGDGLVLTEGIPGVRARVANRCTHFEIGKSG